MGKIILKNQEKVYFDTCAFIYLFEENDYFYENTFELFKKFNKKNVCIISSSILIGELLRKNSIQKNKLFKEFIRQKYYETPNLQVLDLDVNISEYAAKLGYQYSLGLMDCFHLATAILGECKYFISNDKKLTRVEEIKCIHISDYK